ncbi:MAG: aromatic ring-hydroxylating dioxygenase subunit alpha [Novosphingobium sp.]|nr:aromatic ring-hydroxylating dioxygenase subunit alpha [Novosphingobium sp.]
MTALKPGECVDTAPFISEIDFTDFRMRVSTERYSCPEYNERERENLWMRTWQVTGRIDDIPNAGDFMEYRLFDQSYVLVRGRDDTVRGFVNACRHRGNAFCEGRGNAPRFTCPYHNWSYGLDGQCLSVAKPDFDGTTEEFVGDKNELGLIEVPVECFAGFIFLNPDSNAEPLTSYLGEAMELLAPYRVEEMVPHGFNVRETVDCNWKVVLDAFQEGYHIQAVHPELVAAMDETQERYRFCGDHSVATAPFGAANDAGVEVEIDGIRNLPATFPSIADSLPRFEELIDKHRGADGTHALPDGITPRLLLQQALRETWVGKGLDVSALTDNQLTDNHFWILFPNFFMTIHAGEATVIIATPHQSGDPNRCQWHVMMLQWFPPDERAASRTALTEVAELDHFPYFLALEQDYEQMERQQRGLRNHGLKEMALTKQEVRLAHFHAAIDSWVERGDRT